MKQEHAKSGENDIVFQHTLSPLNANMPQGSLVRYGSNFVIWASQGKAQTKFWANGGSPLLCSLTFPSSKTSLSPSISLSLLSSGAVAVDFQRR
ncbi:hypothetical protein QUC31_010706 [Theobroma cacao]